MLRLQQYVTEESEVCHWIVSANYKESTRLYASSVAGARAGGIDLWRAETDYDGRSRRLDAANPPKAEVRMPGDRLAAVGAGLFVLS